MRNRDSMSANATHNISNYDKMCSLTIQLWSQAPLTPSNRSALYRGRGSPVMSWILLKANNGQQAAGVGDKRFFRFKRNAHHLWTAVIRHRLNDITHQKIMRFNQGLKFANIFKVHSKHPQCFRTRASSSHFLSNTPVMTQRIFTGSARVEWLWVNDFGPNEYHIWARVTQHLLTCGEQVTKIWSTNLHCADV